MAKVSLRAYNREIETMIDRGQLDEAVAHCNHILKTFPKHLETYRLLGKAYLELKRQRDAVDIFSRLLNAVPSDFVAHVGMSIIRDEEGRLDDAIWHMERAHETQPSNAAVQSELQRLYNRRDGIQPPRIRMSRGALAHMYVKGELYPQAISEIKGVLKDDPGRSDMQELLALAYYRSGQKNDAADTASALLKRYPYDFDANRVLIEILGAERPDSVHVYRQRVVELDPYAAQVNGTVFQSGEVNDAAVTIERLDWNGQPMSMQSDWGERQAIGLESGATRDEEPAWLKSGSTPELTPPTPSAPTAVPSIKDSSPTQPPAPVQPSEDIPDFLRQAGWGPSTGAYDESKSTLADETTVEPSGMPPIEKGEMPDWLKAMAPVEETESTQEEEIPDWIDKIGTEELPFPTAAESTPDAGFDWMPPSEQVEQPQEQAPEDQLDWLKGIGEEEEQPAAPVTDEQPDWLKEFGEGSVETSAVSESTTDEMDWLGSLDEEKPAEAEQPMVGSESFEEQKTEAETPSVPEPTAKVDTGSLGVSEQERDDAFAWLESLAAKQGASEGLLTKPEERLEEEPDWIKQAKGLNGSLSQPPESKFEEPVAEAPVEPVAAAASAGADEPGGGGQEPAEDETVVMPKPVQPVGSLDELGKSEQERDDAFAWLESLAVKQGASEGLLIKPEERREQEPDWVKQVRDTGRLREETAESESLPEPEHASTAQDTAAWLRSLEEEEEKAEAPEPAAVDETAAWLQSLDEEEVKAEIPEPAAVDETAAWLQSLDEEEVKAEASEPVAADETAVWLQGLDDEEVKAETPEPAAADETGIWLRGLEEEPSAAPQDETAMWLESLDQEQEAPAAEPTVPENEAGEISGWMGMIEESPAEAVEPVQEVPESGTDELPGWLSDLEQEERREPILSSEDLPSWLRDETGELVAEPTKIEPTRASDWKPLEPVEEEPPQAPPPAPQPAPVAQMESQPQAVSEPEPEPPAPPEPAPQAKRPAAAQKEVKPATPPEPYKEPVTQRGTGMLTMPVDPILGSARNELSRSNIPGALETYGKLIKKGRYLDEVIYDLREALYRYPVEVSIWQSLGDAYMRANRLQDALDAYTKAEELLR